MPNNGIEVKRMNITKNVNGTTYRIKIRRENHQNYGVIENTETEETLEVKLQNRNGRNEIHVDIKDKRKVEDFLGLEHIEKSPVGFSITDSQMETWKKEIGFYNSKDKESGIRGFGDPVEGTKAGNSIEGGKTTEEDKTPRHPTEEQVYQ